MIVQFSHWTSFVGHRTLDFHDAPSWATSNNGGSQLYQRGLINFAVAFGYEVDSTRRRGKYERCKCEYSGCRRVDPFWLLANGGVGYSNIKRTRRITQRGGGKGKKYGERQRQCAPWRDICMYPKNITIKSTLKLAQQASIPSSESSIVIDLTVPKDTPEEQTDGQIQTKILQDAHWRR
ncbi:hypothetical protein EVAR_35404_1 [Eumeta japonica]|uniref:Uncharacterized protein n=1 Tax=Eumeta variegata TaxID=151549 RepID=A0A4C1XAN3_EUMVA|nr:hypothetical protein EVAR_35404_1 [Eumeta japonica]